MCILMEIALNPYFITLAVNIAFCCTFHLWCSQKFCNVYSGDSLDPLLNIWFRNLAFLLFFIMNTFFFIHLNIFFLMLLRGLVCQRPMMLPPMRFSFVWEERTQCLILVSLKPNFHKDCQQSLARENWVIELQIWVKKKVIAHRIWVCLSKCSASLLIKMFHMQREAKGSAIRWGNTYYPSDLGHNASALKPRVGSQS